MEMVRRREAVLRLGGNRGSYSSQWNNSLTCCIVIQSTDWGWEAYGTSKHGDMITHRYTVAVVVVLREVEDIAAALLEDVHVSLLYGCG